MSEKIEVRATHHFKASAERVYDAWLDPDKVRVWLSTALKNLGLSGEIGRVEIDPKVGGAFMFTDMRNGTEARHWGTYLELERPDRIVFTWITADKTEDPDPSKVTLTIQPEGDGCIATLVHELDAKWSDYLERTENGWSCMMKAIASLLD